MASAGVLRDFFLPLFTVLCRAFGFRMMVCVAPRARARHAACSWGICPPHGLSRRRCLPRSLRLRRACESAKLLRANGWGIDIPGKVGRGYISPTSIVGGPLPARGGYVSPTLLFVGDVSDDPCACDGRARARGYWSRTVGGYISPERWVGDTYSLPAYRTRAARRARPALLVEDMWVGDTYPLPAQ